MAVTKMIPSAVSRRTLLASSAAGVLAGCLGESDRTPPVSEDDWRMYGRDPGRSRFVPGVELPSDGIDVAWEHRGSEPLWRPPIVAGGTVYASYGSGISIVDRVTGKGATSDLDVAIGEAGPLAFAGTTVYEDGVLVAPYYDAVAGFGGTESGVHETVTGLTRSNVRWWTELDRTAADPPSSEYSQPMWGVSPLVSGDRIVSAFEGSTVCCLDPNNGREQWRYDLDEIVSSDGYGTILAHVIDQDSETVVLRVEHVEGPERRTLTLIGIDLADGSRTWTAERDERRNEHGGALVASDGTAYTLGWTDRTEAVRLLSIDAETGELGWETTIESAGHVGLAISDTTLCYVGVDGADPETTPANRGSYELFAFDRETGDLEWEQPFDDIPSWNHPSGITPDSYRIHPTGQPTITENVVLVPGFDGLHAFDVESGDHVWSFPDPAADDQQNAYESRARSPAIVSGDRILVCANQTLYALT